MNQKRNLASSLICFSFIVLVAVVVGVATLMPKESSFGFMQTSDALQQTLPFPKLYRLLLPIQKGPLMEKA